MKQTEAEITHFFSSHHTTTPQHNKDTRSKMLRAGIALVSICRATPCSVVVPARAIGKSPFGDLTSFMGQASKMMEAETAKRENMEAVGTAGGGMVSITLNGLGQ